MWHRNRIYYLLLKTLYFPEWCITVTFHSTWGRERKISKLFWVKSWNYKTGVPQTSHRQVELSASGEVFPKPSIFSSDKGLWTTIRFLMFSFVHWGMAHTAFHSFFICFYSYKSHCVTVHQSPCQLLFMEKMKMILKSR